MSETCVCADPWTNHPKGFIWVQGGMDGKHEEFPFQWVREPQPTSPDTSVDREETE